MPPPRSLAGKSHAHGCTKCRRRYLDSCKTPGENQTCLGCRNGEHPIWQLDAGPKDCCRAHSVPTKKEDRDRYGLAGEGDWWICRICSRQHPHNPTKETP